MSLVKGKVSAKKVAANQANAQKSTGPKTEEGKARVALNGLKGGAYARSDRFLRLLMRRRGDEPEDFEQVHQDLVDSWHPDDAMQAMVVSTITDKTLEKLGLRRESLESQLTAFQCGQIEAQRRKLRARRWLPGTVPGPGMKPSLWLANDSPQKFRKIYQALNQLQEWCENRENPYECDRTLDTLYGDLPTRAGQRIMELFGLFSDDEAPVISDKAWEELPRWIAQERRDVQREQELYQREVALLTQRPNFPEKELQARETALDRQIAEQSRLLLQLKSKRSLWALQREADEAAGPATAPANSPVTRESSTEKAEPMGRESEESEVSDGVIAEAVKNGEAKPIGNVESTT